MHVVGLDQHGSDELVHVEVRQEVEDVLHVVHDLLFRACISFWRDGTGGSA